MRELTFEELELVAGGEDQVGEEVVVVGPKGGRQAAIAAYDRAWYDVTVMGTIGFGALGALGVYAGGSYAGMAAVGAGGYLESKAEPAIIEALANYYYEQDGADGVYDGQSNADRQNGGAIEWQIMPMQGY